MTFKLFCSKFSFSKRIGLFVVSLLFLTLSVIGLVETPRALDIVSPTVLASNIPNNQVITSEVEIAKIKAQEKSIPLPIDHAAIVPQTSAAAVLVEDLDTQTVLYVKDPDRRVPIASTTKIMTSIVSLGRYQLGDVLTVNDLSQSSGSTMGLKVGEKITSGNLLYGLLLNSGNDAAFTLAQNYPGGVSAFVNQMNLAAKNLGLLNTHFDNPAGFDSPNHYSSAWDLSKIAQTALENPQFAKVVATKRASVTSADGLIIHPLENVNELLGKPGVLGIKTGYTPEAKENFVGLFQRNGHKVLTVVLGSDDRFGETETLVNWTYNNFTWSK